jgi:hypothetical protein
VDSILPGSEGVGDREGMGGRFKGGSVGRGEK